ncbi:MAG: response regulator [Acidimicrobiales bacterium]
MIEDDPDIVELVSWKLRSAGFDVSAEIDGAAGLAAALTDLPDLIVLDWMMPRRSGIEVCQELRQDRRTASIPVILLTARAQERDIEQGFAAGANDYIVKPFSPRELVSRINALLPRIAI